MSAPALALLADDLVMAGSVYVRGGPLHWQVAGLHIGNAPASAPGQ